MWFTSEPSLRMSSFKSKIRRRKYALSRGGASSGSGPPPDVAGDKVGGCTKEAAAEWEFVNFNPVIYGRGRSLAQPPPPPPLPVDNGCGLAPPPPLPPRESYPVMPPPRPPPFMPFPPATTVSTQDVTGERPFPGGRGGSERRPDPVRETEERPVQESNLHNEDDYHHEISHPVHKKPTTTSINRSESYKERVHQKRQLRERRKTSDPNLSKTNDVDLDTQGLSYNTNSGSSSNSSLSTRSLDSPSNSLETVTATRAQEAGTATPTANNSAAEWDSDLEAEPDPPDWSRGVDEEVLKNLCAREKKRQEVINELFHTERSHVRNLKVIDQVFYRPIVENQVLPSDHIQLLFSNLDEMLCIHSQFNNLLKVKRRDSPVVGDIAEILLSMFDGPAGENFQRAAATFCARQQIALESLKERRRKDAKLNNLLTDAEGNSMCRRLQLKDIIPTAMQRLTKYPLLFENLAKYTEEDTEELVSVQRAVERSKEILNHVNQAVREAEDYHRLTDIQRRLEKSGFDKLDHPMAGECKHLDVTKHRLIHEGPLCWRVGNRQKLIDLHVLLLDDAIILLQKQDEKYILKFYNMNTASGGSGPTHSPIIKMSTILVRHNAVDKKALYLVNTAQNGAQIYDMVATSSSERKTWFRHISDAAEAYKLREGRNRRTEPSGPSVSTPDNGASESTQDKTKDCDETDGDVKEGNNVVPPAGCSSTSQDVESSPVSASANDSTSLPSSESAPTTPQASPSSVPADGADPLARRMGDGMLSPSPGAQRRRVEPLRLTTEESPLVQPSEVVVSQRPVLTAEPVLTPIEQLRRKDEAIRLALAEKQQLVADILHVPKEEFENIAEIAGEPSVDKEATELVLAAVSQANQLASILNDSLRVTEEEAVSATSEVVPGSSPRLGRRVDRLPGVPAHKLQSISTALNAQLTQLLKIIKDRDEERERLRRELQRSREQLHVMHESHRRNQLNTSSSPSHSRPSSLISQEGSCEPHHDSEDDTGLHKSTLTGEHDSKVIDVCDLGTDKHSMSEQHDDTGPDVFVDALTGETEGHLEAESELLTKVAEGLEAVTNDSLAQEHKIDDDQRGDP